MAEIHKIADQLRHPEEEVRKQAIERLILQRGGEVLNLLNEALGDSSWRVRKTASEVISKYPDRKNAISLLINCLYDSENAGRRTSAIEALIQIGSDAVEDLIQAYNTRDADVRKFVIDILGDIAEPKALDLLLKAIEDEDENVRLSAVEALGKINGEQAVKKLLELVEKSQDLTLRFSALHILGKLGVALPQELVDKLVKERLFRRAVFEVLGQVPSPQGVDYLLSGICDSAKSVRQSAIRSLAKIYESDQEDFLRERIERGLERILNNQALEQMKEFLEGNHHSTRKAVLLLLSLMVSPQAWEYLFQASLDDSLSGELGEYLERLRERYPDQFRRTLLRQPEEVRQAVKRLLREEEALSIESLQSQSLTDEEFNQIRTRLSASYGLYFDDEMKYLVERRVKSRIRQLGLKRVSDYLQRLEDTISGGGELNILANLLATNETYFFREEFQLRAFQDEIMPELIEYAQRNNHQIKIWSAGCASGEEPYTIAMLLKERDDLEGIRVEIYGTDMSKKVIEKAKQGVYSASSFRVINPYYLEKYFIPQGDKFQLREEIKKMVKFDCFNLLSFKYPEYLKELDIIFCRNVLIYFSLEAKRALVERFFQLLRGGGFLLLGHSESLLNLSTAFQIRHFKNDLVYQKPFLEERMWKRG